MKDRIMKTVDKILAGVLGIAFLAAVLSSMAWLVDYVGAQTPPSCEDQRDGLFSETGQLREIVGKLSIENRKLAARVADLEKQVPKEKKP